MAIQKSRIGAKEFDEVNEITSTETLTRGKYHHVSMTVNNVYGLALYIDGKVVASHVDFKASLMEYPRTAQNVSILSVFGIYDDFRLYEGIVTGAYYKCDCKMRTFTSTCEPSVLPSYAIAENILRRSEHRVHSVHTDFIPTMCHRVSSTPELRSI